LPADTLNEQALAGIFPQVDDAEEAEDQQLLDRIRAIREDKARTAVLEGLATVGNATGHPGVAPVVHPDDATAIVKWAAKLPQDVGIAVWDTVRNVAELSLDAGAAIADAQFQQLAPMAEAMGSKAAQAGGAAYRERKAADSTPGARALRDLQVRQGADLPPNLDDVTSLDLRDIAPEWVDAIDKARAWAGQGDNQADVITQKLFQFAGPFAGMLRVLGGVSRAPGVATWLANTGKVAAADVLTSYAVFDPHEARFADLLKEIGPQDNRLLNDYIDYAMSSRDDTDAEGRWKNAVDGFVVGLPFAAGGAIFHSGKALARTARGEWRAPMLPEGEATPALPGAAPSAEASAGRLPVSAEFEQYERQLTPETRAELIAMRADAEAYLPAYRDQIRAIAEEVTGSADNARVPPLKGWDRIAQKVTTEEGGKAAGIRDLVRSTILVKSTDEGQGLWDRLHSTFGQAPNTSARRSLIDIAPDDFGYVDIKLNVPGPNGRVYEIQATTPELWDLKENGGHVFYAKARDIAGRAAAEARPLSADELKQIEELKRQSREHYAPGLEALRSRRAPLTATTTPLANRKEPSGSSSRQAE
jgi:hypothetical protein